MGLKGFGREIPTNIVTGFLGAGKTTAIRYLLQTKPAAQKWAVLVNEFGEVGIDGALLNADGIAVKEVPGGCMCCAAGLPSRLALNQLIHAHKPDRLIIEPTGLAHPGQVLAQFCGDEYAGVLDMRALICLVDPWCCSDPQFMSLPAFKQQIALADILVASKADIAEPAHLQQFQQFAGTLSPPKARVAQIAAGALPWRWLDAPHAAGRATANVTHVHRTHAGQQPVNVKPVEFDRQGVARVENAAEFGASSGWRFSASWRFDSGSLMALFRQLQIPRIKGVFATEKGWLTINKMRAVISQQVIAAAAESRVEMIALEAAPWQAVDRQLRACRLE